MLFLLYIQVLAKKLINNYYPLLNVITITKSYNIIPMQKIKRVPLYNCRIHKKSTINISRSLAGQGARRTIDEKRLAYINVCRIGNSASNRVS